MSNLKTKLAEIKALCEANKNVKYKQEGAFKYEATACNLFPQLIKCVEVLDAGLQKISTTEFLAYRQGDTDADHQYKMGVTDGHRLAATWASDARKQAEEILGGTQ